MSEATTLLWFRQDLRLSDNPALRAAIARGGRLACVFVLDPEGDGDWAPGGASSWWLHHSLAALEGELAEQGQRLLYRRGPAAGVIQRLARETRAQTVMWNRCYEPAALARDGEVERSLRDNGVDVEAHIGSVIFEPWTHATQTGEPFRVFTPFWNQMIRRDDPPPPLARPRELPPPPREAVEGGRLEDLELLPKIDWAGGLRETWKPGQKGAEKLLATFTDERVGLYDEQRDIPSAAGTSRLSPHLRFGEISPREVWHAVRKRQRSLRGKARDSATGYLRQIAWREFAYHLLYHYPRSPERPLREAFRVFPWRESAEDLRAWQRGLTGYPIVDAGMRELWHTGWLHNRVRMIVGSFLVKHLLLHWNHGSRWFWDTLVDADLANNTLGWQWIAGCGADAAPYFRVFNPILQGTRFDPDGQYVRRWVPELRSLPGELIHEPWTAPRNVLKTTGVVLGRDYPEPIVEHGEGRDRALRAYEALKSTGLSMAVAAPGRSGSASA